MAVVPMAVAWSRAESAPQPILITVNKIDLSAFFLLLLFFLGDPRAVTDPFAQSFPGVPVVLTSAIAGVGLDARSGRGSRPGRRWL